MAFVYSIIVLAIISRFFYLAVIPPLGIVSVWWRVISAIAGVANVVLLMSVIKHQTRNFHLARFSGLVMALMPWAIEQSRLFSPINIGLTVALFGLWVYPLLPCRLCKILMVITGMIVVWRIYPEVWIFTSDGQIISPPNILNNLMKLVSVEFLFFKNDSFWWGGFRPYGVMLPSMLIFFIFGLGTILRKFTKKYIKWTFLFILVWLVAAMNPAFPENRTFFLVTPFFCLILALGITSMFRYSHKNLLIKISLVIYILFVIYDHMLFFHFYCRHYPQRIKGELTNEQINF